MWFQNPEKEVLWWLILYVNLTELREDQIASKTLFLGVSAREFPEEIRFWISRPLQNRWVSSNMLKAQTEQKGGGICSLPDLGGPPPPVLRHWSSWFLGLQTLGFTPVASQSSGLQPWTTSYISSPDSNCIIPLIFLVLWLTDEWSWGLPGFHNHISQFL